MILPQEKSSLDTLKMSFIITRKNSNTNVYITAIITSGTRISIKDIKISITKMVMQERMLERISKETLKR